MPARPYDPRMAAPATVPARGTRCWWCGTDPVYVKYHDTEWGVPVTADRALYEKLVLDGFQAGLSWITILRKRAAFRRAFDGFDPAKVDEILGLGERGLRSVVLLPLGYRAAEGDWLVNLKKVRRPREQFVTTHPAEMLRPQDPGQAPEPRADSTFL